MSRIVHSNTHRIPGNPPPLESNALKDLTKLTLIELLDTKTRLKNILDCKKNTMNLPDKGKRVQECYKRILAELDARSNADEAALKFSQLNIANKGVKALNNLEWYGKLKNSNNEGGADDVLDSDDECEDPLCLIAQQSMHERRVKIILPEPSLITPADLKEINSFQQVSVKDSSRELSSELVGHAVYLIKKTESDKLPPPEKFKPYKTTISNVHDPEKERNRKKGKHWENTAATPPPIERNGTKMISLADSVELQIQRTKKVTIMLKQQAQERLIARSQRLETRNIILPSKEELKNNPSFTSYRNQVPKIEGELIMEDNDLSDGDDDKGGVSVYSIRDD